VRAIAPTNPLAAEGKDELCIIQSLTEESDTSDTVTRIYPRSGDRLTLAATTRDDPTGYTSGTTTQGVYTHYYIQHDAGVAAYGVLSRWVDFSEISMQQADSLTIHPEMVANQLFDRSVEWLRTHGVPQYYYNLNVTQVAGMLRAGETIDAVYHEWAEDSAGTRQHTVDIDTIADGTALWILAPTIQITSDGIAVVGLEVSTVDRERMTDAGVVTAMVRERRRYGDAAGNIGTISVTGSGTPPTAGADIRVSGYHVSRAGAGVLLFSGAGALLTEYSTVTAALAASTDGDIVRGAAGTYAENLTVPAGVTLRGMGAATVIDGAVVLGEGARLIDVTASLTDTDSDDLIVVQGGNGAVCVHVTVIGEQSGTGAIIGIVSTADSADTPMRCYDCPLSVENKGTGSAWWTGEVVAGGLQMHHGSVEAEIA
jgi:hypothetical protein